MAVRAALVASLALGLGSCSGKGTEPLPAVPAGMIRVLIETTMGDIVVDLDSARAPVTVGNFLHYADVGAYAPGTFYRAVTDANQPTDSVKIAIISARAATTAPVYPAIPLERTSVTGITHRDGTISMARTNVANSATSVFFICVGDQPELDYGGKRVADGQGFAAFGNVVSGMGVVRDIHKMPTSAQNLLYPITFVVRRLR